MVSRVDRYPLLESALSEEDGGPQSKLLVLGTCAVEPIVDGLVADGALAQHYLFESHSSSPIPVVDTSGYDASLST